MTEGEESERKVWPPPGISTPKRAPWEEVGELTKRLDKLIDLMENLYLTPGEPGEPGLPGLGYPPNADDFRHGQEDVVITGVAVRFSEPSAPIQDGYKLTVIAKPGNAAVIYVGRSKEEAQGHTKFDGLDPGLAISLPIKDLNLVWISGTAGDGASWIYPKRT